MILFEEVAAAGRMPTAALGARNSLSAERISAAVGALVQAGLIVVFRDVSGDTWVRPTAHAPVRGLLQQPAAGRAPAAARTLLEARARLDDMLGADAASTDDVERVLEPAEIARTLVSLVRRSRKEVISVLAGPPPSEAALAASRADDLEMLRRPVKTRILYPREYAGEPRMVDYSREMSAAGAAVRFADQLPHRLLVCDRRVAMMPIDEGNAGQGALVIRERLLVRGLAHLANTLSRCGRSLDEAVAASSETVGPSPVERRVLILMSSGMSDAACGHRLGVTDRTFRRYVSALLQHLGASSRFDAGVKAVEHGWI